MSSIVMVFIFFSITETVQEYNLWLVKFQRWLHCPQLRFVTNFAHRHYPQPEIQSFQITAEKTKKKRSERNWMGISNNCSIQSTNNNEIKAQNQANNLIFWQSTVTREVSKKYSVYIMYNECTYSHTRTGSFWHLNSIKSKILYCFEWSSLLSSLNLLNMASVFKYIKVENAAGLRKLIISNPAKRNALNIEAYNELTGGVVHPDVTIQKRMISILTRLVFLFQMLYKWLLSMIQYPLSHWPVKVNTTVLEMTLRNL